MWQDPIHPVYAVTPIKMDFVRAILSAHPLLLMLDFNNVLLLATLRLALCVRNHSLELGALRTKHDETGRDRWHTWNDRCTCSPRGWFRSFTPLSRLVGKPPKSCAFACFCIPAMWKTEEHPIYLVPQPKLILTSADAWIVGGRLKTGQNC